MEIEGGAMSVFRQFTEGEIRRTLREGEIPPEIREPAPYLVSVWTQDWCPQWIDMQQWILTECGDVPVYLLVYNRHPLFKDILDFKEQVWKNLEIPYVRHYRRGKLIKEHNWIPREKFHELVLKLTVGS